jgi:hypothetical protein
MTTFTSDDREEAYKKMLEEAPAHIGYEDAVEPIPFAGMVNIREEMNNEPVAWMFQGAFDTSTYVSFEKPNPDIYPNPTPLFTHPAKTPTLVLDGNRVYPTTKTLTDEEIEEVWMKRPVNTAEGVINFARAILREAGINE